MAQLAAQPDRRSRFTLVLIIVFLAVVLLCGGASRADVPSQSVVRVAAILMIVFAAVQFGPGDWTRLRAPLLFVSALMLIMLIQLVPLPPGLWASLPGRAPYAQALEGAGLPPVWRPLSLTPDLTLNSLLALLPLAGALLGLGATRRADHQLLVPVVLAGIAASAVLGVLQVAGGSLYLYRITNEGSAVGFLSNRNHHAAFLACALPLLAYWGTQQHRDPAYERLRTWIALCAAAVIFPVLLMTGSRAGLLLGLLGALAAVPIALGGRKLARHGRPSLRTMLLLALPVIAGIASVGAALLVSRDLALQRLVDGVGPELRTGLLPTFFQMARDFFPFGSGFGSFDSVFRAYEPNEALNLTYLNHAHNDPLQLLIEGGAPAAALFAVLAGWCLVRSVRLFSARPRSPADLLGRAGAAIALLLLLSSIVDYPLRTPLISVLMTLACFWMLPSREPARARGETEEVSAG